MKFIYFFNWRNLILELYYLLYIKFMFADMVKNKGFLPSDPSEIPIQRGQIKEIVCSLLPACVEDDPISKVSFDPDAIIANPPAYG